MKNFIQLLSRTGEYPKLAVMTVLVVCSMSTRAQWIDPGTLSLEFIKGSWITPADELFAVGDGGFLMHSTDCGATWTAIPHPIPGDDLESIYFLDESTAFITAENGKILRSTNGGATWTVYFSPAPNDLYKTEFATSLIGFAVGRDGGIVKTTNGGTLWTAQTSGTVQRLHGIHMFNTMSGIVVGRSSTYLSTSNGGTTWTPSAVGIPGDLYDIEFVDGSTGYIAAEFGAYKSINGGATWVAMTLPAFTQWNSVHFVDDQEGYLCGVDGIMLQTLDGGVSWSQIPLATTLELMDVFVNAAGNGIVVGENGAMRVNCTEAQVCLGDFNLDGVINTEDLLMLLTELGCFGGCSYDMTNDDAITTSDLLAFLALFGTAC